MIGLLVTVCALATPSLCEEHVRPLHGANELTCLMVGQAEAAATLRPGWRVTRYGCTRVDPVTDAAPDAGPAAGPDAVIETAALFGRYPRGRRR